MIDWSMRRFHVFGMKMPATAMDGPRPMRTAERIHFPLATTSIFVALPFCATSSKKRGGGSASSAMAARGVGGVGDGPARVRLRLHDRAVAVDRGHVDVVERLHMHERGVELRRVARAGAGRPGPAGRE